MSSANDGNQTISDWDGYSMSSTYTSPKESSPQVNNSDIANDVFFEDQILWGNDPNKSYFAYMMEGERVWQETHPNSSILHDTRTLDDGTNHSLTIMAPSDTSDFNTTHTRVADVAEGNKNGLVLGDGHTEYIPPEAPRNGTVLVMNTNPIAQSYPIKVVDIPSVIYVDQEVRPRSSFMKQIFGSNETASIGQSFDIGRSNRRLLIAFILLLIITISAAATFVALSLTRKTSPPAHATGRVGDESLEFQPPVINRNDSVAIPTMFPSAHGNWSSSPPPVDRSPTRSPSITSAVPSQLRTPSSAPAPASKNTDKPKTKTFDRPSHTPVDAVLRLTPQPSMLPSSQPQTYHLSAGPSLLSTDELTPSPTDIPPRIPVMTPKDISTLIPTSIPTPFPSLIESLEPTFLPTNIPSLAPLVEVTLAPTKVPSNTPTPLPVVITTPSPSPRLTKQPSNTPTPLPVVIATPSPSPRPTKRPSKTPTSLPVEIATPSPSPRPTKRPSKTPTNDPTRKPRDPPSSTPTFEQTETPTIEETETPTNIATTLAPSVSPIQPHFMLNPTPLPSIQEIPVQASINVDKTLYTLGESIVVRFQNNPPRNTDWIAMQNLDDVLVEMWPAALWVWTCGTQTCGGGQDASSEGTVVFKPENPDKDGFDALQPGTYIMHLLRGASSDSYESFAKSSELTIVAAAPITTPTVDTVPTPDSAPVTHPDAAPAFPPVTPPDAAPASAPVSPPDTAPAVPPVSPPDAVPVSPPEATPAAPIISAPSR